MSTDHPDYVSINRESWNKRTLVHFDSEFYDVSGFLSGKSSLNKIELDLLPDLNGKKVLHLQCHFGQDTISLERLGAEVVGVDLSDEAIKKAKLLASESKSNARFVCCDVYDLPNHINEEFDFVFTSYGTIGWLPDLDKWANIVSQFLKPKGQFLFVDFHPVVWMYDDDFTHVKYRYFNTDPIIESQEGTYTDGGEDLQEKTISWNHGLSEVVTSLLQKGLQIKSFKEYDYSPYNCFSGMKEIGAKQYRIESLGNKIPMVYSILAEKE